MTSYPSKPIKLNPITTSTFPQPLERKGVNLVIFSGARKHTTTPPIPIKRRTIVCPIAITDSTFSLEDSDILLCPLITLETVDFKTHYGSDHGYGSFSSCLFSGREKTQRGFSQ